MSRTPDDEYVLSMDLENKEFNQGIEECIEFIDKLKKSMDFDKSVKNLEQFEKATDKIDLSKVENSLSNLEKRFSTLGVAGMEAISNITDSVMRMGTNLAKKIVSPIDTALNQIKTGGMSRALKIEDATFKLKGLLGMTIDSTKKINQQTSKAMDAALAAVRGTAYGLDAAAGAAARRAGPRTRPGSAA